MEYEIKTSETFSAKQLNDAYYEVLLRLTNEMSVKQVIDYLSELLNSTVVLYTHSGNHIFSSCEDSRSRMSLLHLQAQFSVTNGVDNYLERERTSHTETNYPGIYLDHYAAPDARALSGKLTVSNEPLGTLCLLDVDFSALDEQAETLELFCRILSQKLAVSNSLDQKPGQIEQLDINSGAKWFRKLKGNIFQNFYIAVLNTATVNDDQVKQLKAILEQNHLLFRMVIQESFITILFNVCDIDEAAVMYTSLEQFAQTEQISIGLSHRFHGTEMIHDCFRQATDMLNMARYMGLHDQLIRFEQYSVDALLYDFMQTSGLDCYRNERLEQLCAYDDQNGTQYYETLKCYIFCGASKQKASQALYIHRNTLAYRLDQIETLLRLNLNDVDVQTRLYLDIKIKEMLDMGKAESLP